MHHRSRSYIKHECLWKISTTKYKLRLLRRKIGSLWVRWYAKRPTCSTWIVIFASSSTHRQIEHRGRLLLHRATFVFFYIFGRHAKGRIIETRWDTHKYGLDGQNKVCPWDLFMAKSGEKWWFGFFLPFQGVRFRLFYYLCRAESLMGGVKVQPRGTHTLRIWCNW